MSNKSFEISLTPWQQTVWEAEERFKVVAAGRRTGKSRLAANVLIYKALTCPAKTAKVFYVAPTQGQAKDIMWDLIQEIAGDLVSATHKNDCTITLKNGVTIALKGADRPQTMRGVSLWYVVLDEYADIKPDVWETILLPALSDHEGDALFIGTPMGRNHFYELYKDAELGNDEDFIAFHYTSYDNPFLSRGVIERAKKSMSSHNFKQEYMASFEAQGSQLFLEEWIKFSDHAPYDGEYYIAIDPAGFEAHRGKMTKNTRLDDTSICVVKASRKGWYVEDIIHGRWTLAETTEKIFNTCMKYQPVRVGIERGIAQQAILDPMNDIMRQTGQFINFELLTHGNKNKVDRVMWALQGKFENEYITLGHGDWNATFLDQLYQFPSPLTHDDLLDSLAYIDQLVVQNYESSSIFSEDDEGDWDEMKVMY